MLSHDSLCHESYPLSDLDERIAYLASQEDADCKPLTPRGRVVFCVIVIAYAIVVYLGVWGV